MAVEIGKKESTIHEGQHDWRTMKHCSTRQLLILRHAKARKDLPVKDRERPLADEGRDDLRRVATAAAQAGLLPELVLCSPALRARETATLFLVAAGIDPDVLFDELIYAGVANDLPRLLGSVPEQVQCVMLVGHNPDLEDLVRRLCGDRKRCSALHPGALAVFEVTGPWREISAKTAGFKELIDPRA